MSRQLARLWAITPDAGSEIAARFTSKRPSFSRRALELQAARTRDIVKQTGAGRVGIIPIYGPIAQRPRWYSFTSGVEILSALRQGVADPNITSIILDIDSPGGTAAGTPEVADAIFAARERKPIYGIANSQAASAAYWIGSAGTRMYGAPGSEAGSVGVYAMHLDFSAANERMGVKPTYIYAGRYKVEGNPDEPLTDEARAAVQKSVNNVHRDFIRAVARNRGARPSDVILNYGQGRVLDTADALAAGMIDGVATLEQVVEMARSGASRRSSVQAVSAREHSDLKHRWHCKKLRAGTYFSQPAKTESDDDRRRRWRNTKRKAGV